MIVVVRKVFSNQLSLLSIINQNKHVVYHAVYTAHAQNTHVVSIVITRLAILYRDSNETIAIFTLSILSPRPNGFIHSPQTLASIFILDSLLEAVTGYIFRVASFTFSIIIGFNCFLSFFPQTLDLLLSSSLKRTLVRFTAKLPTEQLFCLVVSKK